MPNVAYTFSAAGERAVLAAFRSISAEARRSSAEVNRGLGQQQAQLRTTARQARAGGRGGAAQSQLREQQRAAREQVRAQQQADRERVRSARQAERQIQQAYRRRVAAWKRGARETAREEQRRWDRRARTIRSVGGIGIRGVGAVGAATAGVVGLAARQGIQLQGAATRLAVKGSSALNRVDPTALRKEAEDVARNVRGAKAADVIGAQERFVGKTGRLDLARDFAETFAKISVATGTEMEAIGSAAADMMEKFDIKSVQDMEGALAMLAVQGKRGAFELTDAASQFPKIAAAAQRFGLEGVEGLATLGGLSQIARRATPSGEEAATSVEAMFKQLVMKSGQLEKKYGVKVFEDKGKTKTRDVKDILVEAIAGAKGNQESLQKIFDVRGIRAVSPLISLFNKTRGAAMAGGATETDATAAAVARLRKEIDGATNVTNARTEIERDLATQQQQTSVSLTAAWESIVADVSEDLVPTLAQEFTKLAAFVSEVDFGGVITGFKAVAEAAGLLADGLIALDIIERKKKTPAQLLKEGEREAAALAPQRAELNRRARLSLGDPSVNRAALNREFEALAAKEAAAQSKIATAKGKLEGDPAQVLANVTQAATEEAIKKEGGFSGAFATTIARTAAQDPSQAGPLQQLMSAGDWLLRRAESATMIDTGFGPTEEGAARQQLAVQQLGETQVAGQTISTEEVNAKLGQLAGAIGDAAGRIRAAGGATAFVD